MWKEFKAFVSQGNVFGLAVGIIIGAAFGKIVSSFVSDIIMPPIGLLLGGMDFTNLFYILSGPVAATLEEAQKAGTVTINYGLFIRTLIDFLIIAATVFLVIRWLNRLNKPEPTLATPNTRVCPRCFSTIPLAATRCPHCTSELTAATEPG